LLTTCNSNLAQLKTTLNQSLAAAANLNTQIKTLENNIAQWLPQTGPKIDQLKKLTADLSALVSQYAAAVGATV
jgi:septal ring factor EnvC (AmiA/AmiB activator)